MRISLQTRSDGFCEVALEPSLKIDAPDVLLGGSVVNDSRESDAAG